MGTAWVAGCGFLQRGRTRLLAMEGIQERKGVVCVGLVCLDLVTVVDHFPKEDTDMRSSAQYKVRGGNANNSCRVLAELGFPATFLGSLAGQGDADTFNAAVIGCLAAKLGLASSVRTACQVAGTKVGMRGFKGLGQQTKPILALALASSTPCL